MTVYPVPVHLKLCLGTLLIGCFLPDGGAAGPVGDGACAGGDSRGRLFDYGLPSAHAYIAASGMGRSGTGGPERGGEGLPRPAGREDRGEIALDFIGQRGLGEGASLGGNLAGADGREGR